MLIQDPAPGHPWSLKELRLNGASQDLQKVPGKSPDSSVRLLTKSSCDLVALLPLTKLAVEVITTS